MFGYFTECLFFLEDTVPSLIRFLVVIGVIGGLVYGGMLALAFSVEPNQREMTIKIPSKRINK